ncbi:MAG: hypothetical protein RR448_06090 [Niameybacter sp.]
MKKRLIVFLIGVGLLMLAGCDMIRANTSRVKEAHLLTTAPELYLSDSLASVVNEFRVQSGNYTWNYLDKAEVVSLIACGSHPLDDARIKEEVLKLPEYNKIDYVPYTVSCVVAPDKMIINEWDSTDIGNIEATLLSSATYEQVSIVELKPDRVYEMIAIWSAENLEVNGFHGQASYVCTTSKQ